MYPLEAAVKMFSKLITWTILLVCEHFTTDSYSCIILSLKLLNFTLNDSHSYLTYFLSFSLGRLAIASDWCETISQAPHRFSKPFYVSSCWLFYRDAVYNYVQTFTSFYIAKSPKHGIFNKSDSCESSTNHITNTSNVSPCSCKFILIKPFVQNIHFFRQELSYLPVSAQLELSWTHTRTSKCQRINKL